jgi:phosphoglycerate-specific signal transduction histidine kinase
VIREADELTPEDLGFGDAKEGGSEVPLERHQIEGALLNANGSVSRAASTLGHSRQALYPRMEKAGIVMERKPRCDDVMRQALVPFYTTKPAGSGLGLPLCNEIVEAHGGRMRLESSVEGTVVTAFIPD